MKSLALYVFNVHGSGKSVMIFRKPQDEDGLNGIPINKEIRWDIDIPANGKSQEERSMAISGS